MPNPLEAVATGAHDEGRLLLADGAVQKGGKVIAEGLQAIQDVIEVLDLGNGPQAPEGQPNPLANDCGFAYAGVGNAQRAKLFLEAFQPLVHIANGPAVFPEDKGLWVAFKKKLEIVS